MSQQNVEIAHKGYLAMNSRDTEAFIALLDPDVEFDGSRRTFDAAVYRGHEGFRKIVSLQEEQWATMRVEPQDSIVAADAVVVPVRLVGVGRQSGAETTASAAHVWRFRDGKVIRLTIFQTLGEALEAVGLSQQDTHADS
jgi:ketosteroid isomerase-like protein